MNKDYDQIKKYIEADIDSDLRLLISDFALLWNNYENKLFTDENGNPFYGYYKVIGKEYYENTELYNRINTPGIIDDIMQNKNQYFTDKVNELYDRFKNYYEGRHCKLIDFQRFIEVFNIKKNDIPTYYLTEMLLHSNVGDIRDRYLVLLLVVGRVRNNMFHGIKSIRDLNNQKELFEICNEVLTLTLEVTHKSIFSEGRN